MGESDFLKVRQRANELGGTSIGSILYNKKEVLFSTVGLTNTYQQRVRILDLDLRSAHKLSFNELATLIRLSNIKVSCNCPAFKYWGFKYIATQLDYGVLQENKYPDVRNPNTEGYVCKHLYSVLKVWPFVRNTIASEYWNDLLVQRQQFETFKQQQQYITTVNGLIKEIKQ